MSPDATSPSLARLVAAGVLDAELGGLAALLLDLGVPVLVAGRRGSGRRALLDALVAALPAGREPDSVAPGAQGRLVRVAGTISAATPPGLLRAALAATGARRGLADTVEAADLAGVLEVLRGQGLTGDEISWSCGARGSRATRSPSWAPSWCWVRAAPRAAPAARRPGSSRPITCGRWPATPGAMSSGWAPRSWRRGTPRGRSTIISRGGSTRSWQRARAAARAPSSSSTGSGRARWARAPCRVLSEAGFGDSDYNTGSHRDRGRPGGVARRDPVVFHGEAA